MRPIHLSWAVPLALAAGCITTSPSPVRSTTTTVITPAPAVAAREARGTLVHVSGSQLQLAQGGLAFTIETSKNTVVMLNGVPASVGDLPTGSDVLTSYVVTNGHPLALRVDATSISQ
jgi:hypothetical protein